MEIGIIKIIGEIFKSAPRAGLFLTVLVVAVIAAIKILPLISQSVCGLLSTFMAARSKDQAEMVGIIKSELNSRREESARQFELNERMVRSVEGSLESLRELTARTASLDHRIFGAAEAFTRSNLDEHRAMSNSLNKIEGYISGLS